ncbi:EamA family transporter [Curtobacterium flaccumfaciens]|nr:EamA family transporter [Curtobacterium flaccumfaciens]
MTARDRLLAVVVAVVWGLNFPATALALEHFPPFLLAALRFTILAVPTLLFVPRPRIPFGRLLLVGLGLGVLQFSFLYLSMASGMPSGLASLVLQASAPFTVVLAGVFLRERLTGRQVVRGHRRRGRPRRDRPAPLADRRAAAGRARTVRCARVGDRQRRDPTSGSREPAAPDPVVVRRATGPDGCAVARGRGAGPHRHRTRFGVHGGRAARRPGPVVHRGRRHAGGLRHLVTAAGGLPVEHRSHRSRCSCRWSGVLASWVAFGEVPDLVEVLAGAVVVAAVLWSSRPARGPLTGAYPAPAAAPAPAPIDGVPVPVLSPGAGDAPR